MTREAFLPCPRCGDAERVLLRQRVGGSIALHWWPQQSKCKDTMLHGTEWTDGELNAAWAMSDPTLEAR